MSSIAEMTKSLVRVPVRLLNRPGVKEGIKDVAGVATFIFGLIEIYDIYEICRGRKVLTETSLSDPKWMQQANKVSVICAKVSLILSAGVSRPGVAIISSLTGCFFSTAQLNRVFGPNTTFKANPWHPRHVISIAAVILALPAVAQSVYQGVNWTYRKICNYRDRLAVKQETSVWLTDHKVRLMNLFNFITSLPTLHIGNQFGRWILRSI